MDKLIEIQPLELTKYTAEMLARGARLGQIMCSAVEGGYELTYNFDIDHHFESLRCVVPVGQKIMSITHGYLYAFIWENEIHDLFGLEFEGMVPELDYRGNFFRMEKKTPWKPVEMPSGLGIDASVKNVGGENHA